MMVFNQKKNLSELITSLEKKPQIIKKS